VKALVNNELRQAIRLNHSATHLMHAALRKVLGTHVQQKGSQVTASRLRFDFSHNEGVKPDQLRTIEKLVNDQIRLNTPVQTEVLPIEEAKAKGAMALFGEKYDDNVRVLTMGGDNFSIELCGGTHAARTGDIGLFRIVSEGGVAAGVRRIEAVTGEGALAWIDESEAHLSQIAGMLKGSRDTAVEKVQQVLDRVKQLEKELEKQKAKLASSAGDDLINQAKTVAGIKLLNAVVEGVDGKALRDMVDKLKDKLGSGVILLGVANDGKVDLVAGVTKDLTGKLKAGDLVKFAAEIVGGKGGGRPDLAMAGGPNAAQLPAAIAAAETWLNQQAG
jgi:alanyl-tRNA synthetase